MATGKTQVSALMHAVLGQLGVKSRLQLDYGIFAVKLEILCINNIYADGKDNYFVCVYYPT